MIVFKFLRYIFLINLLVVLVAAANNEEDANMDDKQRCKSLVRQVQVVLFALGVVLLALANVIVIVPLMVLCVWLRHLSKLD